MSQKQIRSIGIVGGNLQAALLCQEARLRGIKTTLLEQQVSNIATHFADEHIIATLTDESLKKLSMRVDTIVFCTDSIPKIAETLQSKCPMFPNRDGLEIIAGRAQQLKLAQELEIPTPTFYYQNNKEAFFEDIENIQIPFRFYQIFKEYHEAMEVLTPEELSDFIFEVDDKAEEWLIEAIGTYEKILSITALKDKKGKISIYPIQDEELDAEDVKYISIPADLTKTTATKVQRYVKKMLKHLDTEGLFTFKFGMKKNKLLELLHINSGITLGDISTKHYMDYSVYEQYLNVITGKEVWDATLREASLVTIVLENDITNLPQKPYHSYVLDHHEEGAVSIYVSQVGSQDEV